MMSHLGPGLGRASCEILCGRASVIDHRDLPGDNHEAATDGHDKRVIGFRRFEYLPVASALCGLRVDDDVPAEQHAADDLPSVRGRVVRAGSDGAGLGHTSDCRKTVPAWLLDTPDLQRLLRRSPAGARPSETPPVIMSRILRFTTRGACRGISSDRWLHAAGPEARRRLPPGGQHGRRARTTEGFGAPRRGCGARS